MQSFFHNPYRLNLLFVSMIVRKPLCFNIATHITSKNLHYSHLQVNIKKKQSANENLEKQMPAIPQSTTIVSLD